MKPMRWKTCVVFDLAADARRLWQFGAGKDRVSKGATLSLPINKPVPANWVRKTWVALISPRLNIGLLPQEHVFLRVVQLPLGDAAELSGMVEFQMERLSPLPVAQVVWCAEAVPNPDGKEQTVIVAIVERGVVEEFLGRLEGVGFVADRLEIPLLRELRAARPPQTGLQLFVRAEVGHQLCLAAWWSGGVLREVTLSRLVAGPGAAESLVGQLTQVAWAAELEGWIGSTPAVQLHAMPEVAAQFQPALEEWSGQPVTTVAPVAANAVAELVATNALKPTAGSLIPTEILVKARQQFIDGIWMRGLGFAGLMYAVGVVGYLIYLNLLTGTLDEKKSLAIQYGKAYTNTIQLREQVSILEEQVTLKFAALDSWRAAAELLPLSLNMSSLSFDKGKTLSLSGYGPQGSSKEVANYESELRKAKVGDQPLFASVKTESIETKGANTTWRITAQLKRTERQ